MFAHFKRKKFLKLFGGKNVCCLYFFVQSFQNLARDRIFVPSAVPV